MSVQFEDIARANALAHEVLGRSLDELPPQTRRVLGIIEAFVEEQVRQRSLVRADVRFTRRELRARCGMSDAAIQPSAWARMANRLPPAANGSA